MHAYSYKAPLAYVNYVHRPLAELKLIGWHSRDLGSVGNDS